MIYLDSSCIITNNNGLDTKKFESIELIFDKDIEYQYMKLYKEHNLQNPATYYKKEN